MTDITWSRSEGSEWTPRLIGSLASANTLRVKLATATSRVLVHRLFGRSSEVVVLETRDGTLMSRVEVPVFSRLLGVGLQWLEDESYVLAGPNGVSRWHREHLLWETAPPPPREFRIEPWEMGESVEWTLRWSEDPLVREDEVTARMKWTRFVGRGGDNEGVWDDRYVDEFFSLTTGTWLRRVEPPHKRIPERRGTRCEVRGTRVNVVVDERVVGIFTATSPLEDADVSLDAKRLVLATAENELLFYELVPPA